MSAGLFGPGAGVGGGGDSLAARAAALEDQIASAVGAPVEALRPAGPRLNQSQPQGVIAGVDLTRGIAVTSYGNIALDQMALSIIMGLLAQAVRDHVQGQLSALNAQLGLPDGAIAASAALARSGRMTTVPPAPTDPGLNGTGHAEGEDASEV